MEMDCLEERSLCWGGLLMVLKKPDQCTPVAGKDDLIIIGA